MKRLALILLLGSAVVGSGSLPSCFLGEGQFDGPAQPQSRLHRVSVDLEVDSQLCHTATLPLHRESLVGPTVPALFKTVCPTAVAWLVIAVVVDSFDAQTFWPIPHVGQEGLKYPPSIADRNSTTAVILKISVLGIGASLNHAEPGAINRGAVPAVAPVKTATRSCVAAFKINGPYNSDLSTGTQTDPKCGECTTGVLYGFRLAGDNKPSKLLADERECFGHNGNFVVSSGGRPATTGARCDTGCQM